MISEGIDNQNIEKYLYQKTIDSAGSDMIPRDEIGKAIGTLDKARHYVAREIVKMLKSKLKGYKITDNGHDIVISKGKEKLVLNFEPFNFTERGGVHNVGLHIDYDANIPDFVKFIDIVNYVKKWK